MLYEANIFLDVWVKEWVHIGFYSLVTYLCILSRLKMDFSKRDYGNEALPDFASSGQINIKPSAFRNR